MSDWQTIDFFFDESLVEDPYPYFDELRAACPVLSLPHLGVVAVTGYDETSEVYRDTETFSSCNSVVGPFVVFPVPLDGDDVGEIVDRYRDQLPMHEHMVTMDPPDHTRERALLMRLITPKRLKDNEAFIWRVADEQLDEFVGDGACEFIKAYTQPFAMLVVADLLGVPEEDHRRFREGFGLSRSPGEVGAGEEGNPDENPLAWLDEWFTEYIEDRRREPRRDVLTDLALATYPDGTIPDVTSVVRTATFLFAAGQETTARLLAAALKHLAEHPDLQDSLRADRDRLSRKITVDVKGEILELKDTLNTMVDQLNAFAGEVTRVAREVGTDGKLGGQAQVPGVAGTWKDLTDSVNSMASNLTGQVRNIAEVSTAIATGDLSKKITVNVSGEILLLKETINTMVDQLNQIRRRSDARRARSRN